MCGRGSQYCVLFVCLSITKPQAIVVIVAYSLCCIFVLLHVHLCSTTFLVGQDIDQH